MNLLSKHINQALILVLLTGLLSGCFGSSSSSSSDEDDTDSASGECSISEQNRFVHEELLDSYYWYQQVLTTVDYDSFASPAETLDFLRFRNLDRFSYITSQSAFDNLFGNGTYIGFGFSYLVENGSSARIRFVYDQSSAGNAGMARGDEILSINGQDVISIIATDGWSDLLGPAEPGIPLSIELRRKSGAVETLELVKGTVTINTVLHSEVFTSGTNIVGYLVFNSFLGTSPAELDPVFTQFRAAGVTQLILDLRYNGGGSIGVANLLASYLRTTLVSNSDLFVELRFNDKLQSENFSYFLEPLPNSLGLDELVVISTGATCSASEQIISALSPYFGQVTTIGGTTCGKPVGQLPVDFCDETLVAVNFASFNADDVGGYFDGIPADCTASDDVGFDFGDPDEPMFESARYFVDNQTCPPVPRSRPEPVLPLMQGLQSIFGAV